jgi:CheY-like chemotaxis protein
VSRRAVVVEDVEVVARAVSSVLNLEGFKEVRVVTDSRQAMDVIRASDPDLVVLDIAMPHLTGAQVIRALGKRPGHRPGLMIFSATPREDLDRELSDSGLGYDAFVQKPATLQALKGGVRIALEAGLPATPVPSSPVPE